MTRSCAVPATWQTSQQTSLGVSFELVLLVVTGVDVCRLVVAFVGLSNTDRRRVRIAAFVDLTAFVCFGGDIGGDCLKRIFEMN